MEPIAIRGEKKKRGGEKESGIPSLSRYGSRHKNLTLSSGSGCSVEEYWEASGSLGLRGLIQYSSRAPGDKGKDVCWHLLSAAGSKWQMAFSAAGY